MARIPRCALVAVALLGHAAAVVSAELLSWDEAYARADATLAQMTPAEKHSMMQGVGWDKWEQRKWWYVGNTRAVPRLGIPSLNLQDAADGFRTSWREIVGTVTSWPSNLALSATWSPDAVRAAAVAIAEEFRAKGANGILGPAINVHRVARSGRNFEYLSGEDPYLGAKLAGAYVEGVQSRGVMSVIKHWVFNQQEENRGTEDSVVDDKTAHELYYPPFQAAVEAGVSAAMCAYNKVNGEHACASESSLRVLKEELGFRGFVQSDWWATHNTSLGTGLDQEMPGANQQYEYFSPEALAAHPQSQRVVDAAVSRILASMYRMGLPGSAQCSPPHCEELLRKDATSDAHAALSRSLAAESIVLLKNEGSLLPLRPESVKTIAVIGGAAVAQPYDPDGQGQGQGTWWRGDYYSGGGSGHVVAGSVVTPLQGIRARAERAGVRVVESPTDEVREAVAAAKQADVAIVVAATTSGESRDRESLALDRDADRLIRAVARVAPKTVVLTQVPGAVVMPWRQRASAILTLFLGGQATGAAWADVLFGDQAPAGRLPLMMPESERDAIPPSKSERIVYSEGMATSYRNKAFKAAFTFGHGLTYTTFEYSAPTAGPCAEGEPGAALCVRLEVRNSGGVAARAVPQLYLEFPKEAGHPSALLKGFEKTGVIAPGASAEVRFRLTERDLSYYSEATGAWVKTAAAVAAIGESSSDIRQTLALSTGEPSQSLRGSSPGSSRR